MINFVQPGDVMNYANAGSAIASGDVVQIGNKIGVAAVAIAASTGTGAVNFKGVYSLTKVGSQAWAQGDKIFWDHTNLRCTKTASSDADTVIGTAWEAVGSGSGETTGLVNLGSEQPGKAAAVTALTGTLTGTVDGAIADIAATAGNCAGTSSPSAANVDTAIATAVASIVTGTNLQLKELQTSLAAVIASLKAAGVMDN